MKRKAKATGNEEINAVVWEWFTNARSENIHISGPMVQSEDLAVAKSLENDQFKVSTGWLDSFKQRHNIVWNRAKAGFGESDVADNLQEVNENIAAISILCPGKEPSCDTQNFVCSNDHLATHYSFESATALLAVRNTQNEDVEDEEEEEEGGEEAA
jgi:hypothetical protein